MQAGDLKSNKSANSNSTTLLYFDISEEQWPIIYRTEYDVRFGGLEKMHPFDAGKWGRIANFLIEDDLLDKEKFVKPKEAKKGNLLMVHSKKYLNSLKWSFNVALISEIPLLTFVPNRITQQHYLKPMRYQVGGTILAGKLALERGFAINIGGGFHHCSATSGGGFCPYADITLLIKHLREFSNVSNVMIIDLDAHQGNGYARDLINDRCVYIMDVYNAAIYPQDHPAKQAIRKKVEVQCGIKDTQYLGLLDKNLNAALEEFQPEVVIYNAGTDILEGDSLGAMLITSDGVIRRDEIVFKKIRDLDIPIVMLTSGGYHKKSARIIADSIVNLKKACLIGPKYIV